MKQLTALFLLCCLFLFACSGSHREKSNKGSSDNGEVTVSIDTNSLENIDSSNVAQFTVWGSCSEEGGSVVLSVGGVRTESSCSGRYWTATLDVTSLSRRAGLIDVTANHFSDEKSATPASHTITNYFVCLTNFVAVSARGRYTKRSFCLAKYEMKRQSDESATSKADETPYVNISRDEARSKCQEMGHGQEYDLVTNDEWQSLTRNVENVSANWSGGKEGSSGGGMNQGHTDDNPHSGLTASHNDNNGCYQTGQNCVGTWHSQKRTHILSNGEVIWDIGGNVSEWVKDSHSTNFGEDAYLAHVTSDSHPTFGSLSGGTTEVDRIARDHFGPKGNYTKFNESPYGGFGYGYLNSEGSIIIRGGDFSDGDKGGVFSVSVRDEDGGRNNHTGFRCVYHPPLSSGESGDDKLKLNIPMQIIDEGDTFSYEIDEVRDISGWHPEDTYEIKLTGDGGTGITYNRELNTFSGDTSSLRRGIYVLYGTISDGNHKSLWVFGLFVIKKIGNDGS